MKIWEKGDRNLNNLNKLVVIKDNIFGVGLCVDIRN